MNFKEFKNKFQKKEVWEISKEINSNPLVSVCIQTYEHVNYIKECLDGILMQQTTFPIEILLGDDESTDGTREICVEYAKKHPEKIKLFLHHRENNIKINGAPTGRFNFSYNLYSARGKYIAFCEGDDYWTDPLKLQKQVDFLEENEEYVLSFHDATKMDRNGQVIQKYLLNENLKKDLSKNHLQLGPHILLVTLCFRNVIRKLPSQFFKVTNGDKFIISVLGNYGKGKFLQRIWNSIYRQHPTGFWSSKSDFLKGISHLGTFFFLEKYYSRNGNKGVASYFRKDFRNLFIQLMDRSSSMKECFLLLNILLTTKKYCSIFLYSYYFIISFMVGRCHRFREKFYKFYKWYN